MECLDYCKGTEIDILLVSELSRLGRNALEVLATIKDLQDNGINLYLQKEHFTLLDKEGKPSLFAPIMLATLATCAELERENIQFRLYSGRKRYIEAGKFTQAVQDTLGKVGMNVEVLPDGTDLLSEDLEEGIYIVDCSKMTNVPSSITKSDYDYALSLLIVDREHKRVMLLGPDTNSTKYPTCAYRHLVQKSWQNTPDSIYSKLMSLQLGVNDSVKKRDDNLETTSKEVIGAINELFNGGVKDTSIVGAKLADATVTSTKIVLKKFIIALSLDRILLRRLYAQFWLIPCCFAYARSLIPS